MRQQAQEGLELARETAASAIERIPPDAWPMIDLMFKITIGLLLVWIFLALVAWWRRRAYNLTVASTHGRSKQAQPDFLSVDKKAREKAIDRGEAHEEALDARDEAEAEAAEALAAAGKPIGFAKRLAGFATTAMSIFTLLTAISGTVLNIGKMNDQVAELTASGKLEYLIKEHTFGVIVVLLIIAFQVWKFFNKKKWKEA
jgi:uncharacterized membrane protein YdbT with pleckstrin-like domain